MKRLLSVILITFTVSIFGQTDISVFNRNTSQQEGQYLMPWVTGTVEGIFYDIRYNFDQRKTLGAFFGKCIPVNQSITLIPEIGILDGSEYTGISPELLIVYEDKYITSFLMNQYSFGTKTSPDYIYHWGQYLWKATNEFRIGLAEQIYLDDFMNEAAVDIGPTIKWFFGNVYVNPWITIDPNQPEVKKFFLGVGYILE